MRPAKVPNDVQREDTILFFITLKQLIMLMVGGGISYLLFVSITKSYELNEFQHTLIWIPLALAAIFAFVKIKGMSTLQIVFLTFEKIIRPPRRYWIQGAGNPFLSMTTTVTLPKDKTKNPEREYVEVEELGVNKIKNIASILDGASHGETFQK